MSRTKIFEIRRIALEANNQAILKSWSSCIKKLSTEGGLFEYQEKKEEVQEGTINPTFRA